MTAPELKDYIATQLAVPVNQVAKILNSFNHVVDYIGNAGTDIIPDWTPTRTFNTDGTGDGKYCKYADTSGNIRVFETKFDANNNNVPPTDPLLIENAAWKEISPAASAAIPEWAPGLFGVGLVIVYYDHPDDGRGLYLLLQPSRPFTSVDIVAEIISGDWALIGSNNKVFAGTSYTERRKSFSTPVTGINGGIQDPMDIPANSTAQVTMYGSAIKNDGTESYSTKQTATYRRGASSFLQIGTTTIEHQKTDGADSPTMHLQMNGANDTPLVHFDSGGTSTWIWTWFFDITVVMLPVAFDSITGDDSTITGDDTTITGDHT